MPDQDLEARIARLEAIEEIRLLAARYATRVDSRDVDSFVELYTDDIQLGPYQGKDDLRRLMRENLGSGTFTTTVHFVGQHDIEFSDEDPNAATGTVYCRAEHECGDLWIVATLQYWDRYEKQNGKWLFSHRTLKGFYVCDVLERPNGEERVKFQLSPTGMLSKAEVPEAYPTWHSFNEEMRSS